MTMMTNQRRRELIEKYARYADDQDIAITHGTSITNHEARDLLALLREDGLEWKVYLHSSPTGMGYYPPELMAACSSESAARHMAKFWGSKYTTITGPDKGEEPCTCATCNPEKVGRQMIVCSVCGFKRCPRAEYHGYWCFGSNNPGQPRRLVDGYDEPGHPDLHDYPQPGRGGGGESHTNDSPFTGIPEGVVI